MIPARCSHMKGSFISPRNWVQTCSNTKDTNLPMTLRLTNIPAAFVKPSANKKGNCISTFVTFIYILKVCLPKKPQPVHLERSSIQRRNWLQMCSSTKDTNILLILRPANIHAACVEVFASENTTCRATFEMYI